MNSPAKFKIIALLALLQGVFAFLRAYNWMQIGSNLFGQGLLLVPLVGAVTVMRGIFVSLVALLYVLFGVGAFLGKVGGGPASQQRWSSSCSFSLP